MMEAFFVTQPVLFFRFVITFSNFQIEFSGLQAILRVVWGWAYFSMWNGGGIMAKFGLGVIYGGFGVSKTFFV